MGYSDFFNLIACVYRAGIDCHSFREAAILKDDTIEKINDEIEHVLSESLKNYEPQATYDKFLFDSETCASIIEWCKTKDDKYIYIYFLRKFDRMIDLGVLCSEYGTEQMTHRNREALKAKGDVSLKGQYVEPSFAALNTNIEETGVILLPNFRKPNESDEGREIGRMSELNDVLHRYSCHQVADLLPGYTIKNVILDPKREYDHLTVGYTPTTNKGSDDAFEVGEDVTETDAYGHDCVYIGDIELRDKRGSTERFIQCLDRCRKEQFGVLIGTEMFGTEELCGASAAGQNLLFFDDTDVPFMIVSPSLVKDNSNAVSVFTSQGELIGKQYKQNPYTYKGKKKERLKDIPRELLLVHVKGLGKFAFPICYDLLDKGYRNLLIDELRTDFLMCPSYSSESIDFEKVSQDAVSAGAYVFWLNSCSAVAGKGSKPISVVRIPAEQEEHSVKRICPDECHENCGACLFGITVPVKREGRLGLVKGSIDIEHIMPRHS